MQKTGFADRLKELREAAGLTQKQLAERADVALRTVSSLEQALYEPVWPTVLALAQALGVEVQAFVVRSGDPGQKHSVSPPQKRERGRPPGTAESGPKAPPKKTNSGSNK
jgi:putative transcriptional regulator